MALYTELYNLFAGSTESDELRNRIYTATAKAAQTVLSGSPTAGEAKWAAAVLASPKTEGQKMFIAVIVQNSSATIEQITSSDDVTVQSEVDGLAAQLIIAYNAV